jgi:hypothetical protein
MGTVCGPIQSLQPGYGEGAGCGVERGKKPFSGLTGGYCVLVRNWFKFT